MADERAKLKTDLLKEMRRRRLRISDSTFERVWEEMERNKIIEEYLSDGANRISDLVLDARGTTTYKRALSKSGRKVQEIREAFSVTLSRYAEGRARMMSKALAIQAADHELVREFRDEVLRGTLTPESAFRFATSPATRFFLKSWFGKWNIPFVGHSAQVIATDADLPGFAETSTEFMVVFGPPERYVRVHVDPPGVTKSILYASRDKEVHESVPVDERLYLPLVEEEGTSSMQNIVSFPWNNEIRRVHVFPNSLLDVANGIALLLAAKYNWAEHEALWFLFTGEIPKIDPLQVTYNLLIGSELSPPVWDVTLRVAPWMPPKEVATAFREAQVQILGSTSESNRFKAENKPEVFEFVLDQGVLPDANDNFGTLFEQWKQKHSDKSKSSKKPYTKRKSTFKKVFEEVREAYMEPNYKLPRREPRSDLEQSEEELLQKREEAVAEIQRINFLLEGGNTEDLEYPSA